MYNFENILRNLKWLGLVGILGSASGNAYLKMFWLFFLFGFIDIFGNLPVFFQSLLQLFSYPLILFSHRFHLPSKDGYIGMINYILPFKEQWHVVNGGMNRKTSHSWSVWPQRYAYDFVVVDENRKSYSGSGKELRDYFCYGKDVLASADGEVVNMADMYPENKVFGDGRVECRAKDMRGNFITIRHSKKEYSTVAHLMPGSISVKVGQNVTRGQEIARCGNSGNTSEPHVHFQLNDGKSFFASAGLPIRFINVWAKENGQTCLADYIIKGQSVENGFNKNGKESFIEV